MKEGSGSQFKKFKRLIGGIDEPDSSSSSPPVDKERDADSSTYSKPVAPRASSSIVSDKTISGGNFGPVSSSRGGEKASHQRASSDQSHSSSGASSLTTWSFGGSGQRACCLDKKKIRVEVMRQLLEIIMIRIFNLTAAVAV
jgi:hypothetical protein